MRIFIYISIAICVVFIVIALLTLKLFNGVFVKVRNTTGSLPHQRAGSSRRQQNNIRDQTHESLTLTAPSSQTTMSGPSHGNTNFIQHNSIRNSHRNNLNYNVQQQQQQQQQQQVVAAAAAAVVLSNQPQRNMQHAMNNLNLNLHQHGQQTAAAAAAAASIAAALQQHASNNLNISHNYQQQQQQLQHPHHNPNLDTNTNNIIMQANMDDLQYKWWWW